MSGSILDCGHMLVPRPGYTGYAVAWSSLAERRICYACAAECDKYAMLLHGVRGMYLTAPAHGRGWQVTNWPGSLRFDAYSVRKSRIGGCCSAPRLTARFYGPDGAPWWIDVRGDMELGTARRCSPSWKG